MDKKGKSNDKYTPYVGQNASWRHSSSSQEQTYDWGQSSTSNVKLGPGLNWTDGKGGHISVSKDGKQTTISGVSGMHIGETRTYSGVQSSSKNMPNFGPGLPFHSQGQGSAQVNIKDSSNVTIHGQKIIGDKKGNFSGIVSLAKENSKESNRSKEASKSKDCRIM